MDMFSERRKNDFDVDDEDGDNPSPIFKRRNFFSEDGDDLEFTRAFANKNRTSLMAFNENDDSISHAALTVDTAQSRTERTNSLTSARFQPQQVINNQPTVVKPRSDSLKPTLSAAEVYNENQLKNDVKPQASLVSGMNSAKELKKQPQIPENKDSYHAAPRSALPQTNSGAYAERVPGVIDSQANNVVRRVESSASALSSTSELRKLQEKVRELERKLENQMTGKMRPEEAIKRIITGQVCSLESFKKLEEKQILLSLALKTHDGNTVNVIIGFLRNTLCKKLFHSTLLQYGACQQYVSFLSQFEQNEETHDILTLMGRSEDAAIRQYKAAGKVVDLNSKVRRLQKFYDEMLSSRSRTDPIYEAYGDHVQNQISLLRLLPVIQNANASGQMTDQTLDISLISSLHHACLHNYQLKENSYASPWYLMKTYKLSDEQCQWVLVSALAQMQRWVALESLFAGKKWHGGISFSSVIGFKNVVKILHKFQALPEVKNKYCSLITDEDLRLTVARQYGCHQTAVETLISKKDRIELTNLVRQLPPQSEEKKKAEYALSVSSIKWKN